MQLRNTRHLLNLNSNIIRFSEKTSANAFEGFQIKLLNLHWQMLRKSENYVFVIFLLQSPEFIFCLLLIIFYKCKPIVCGLYPLFLLAKKYLFHFIKFDQRLILFFGKFWERHVSTSQCVTVKQYFQRMCN